MVAIIFYLHVAVADLGCDFTDGDLERCGYTSKEATGGLQWQAVPASLVSAMLEYDYESKFRSVTSFLSHLNQFIERVLNAL